jgi:hypothetical protein
LDLGSAHTIGTLCTTPLSDIKKEGLNPLL